MSSREEIRYALAEWPAKPAWSMRPETLSPRYTACRDKVIGARG
ncbi:DUF4113 domain-containing protein [Pseudomonas aeruginosa]|uniref:DUF4113 domain-containing protein n=2 Tax=Pseudomonadaceae TaxID=135621 RepID=A0ABD7RSQ9_ECTME|nr:DUF4113 domain-containing protein [Pseudomonas mendocina]TRO11270.1 DUF4113 domain-containing protein [Pseudomonas mendocina]TXI29700.1 MAG: DUF4113 domain-containing protein [Pseudomonas alcaligenes]